MVTEHPFKNKTIWMTRPDGQVDTLTAQLEKHGMTVCKLPLLEIAPLPETPLIRNTVMALDQVELLFFISTNAAQLGMALIENYWPQFPVGVDVFSVGPTTAAVLEDHGLTVHYPVRRMSSEALLALPALQDIAERKALIVRGVGGRELLATALKQRGAQVSYLEIYERRCSHYAPGEIATLLDAQTPDAVIVTSAEALANLATLLATDRIAPATLPLYVSSDRLAEVAAELGFDDCVTMSGADDPAIMAALKSSP